MKKNKSTCIYFDNNSTTFVCPPALKAANEWISCFNPSSDSKLAKPVKQAIEHAADVILSHCEVSTATHTAIFTSGATESNCFIIRACVKSYKKKLQEKESTLKPHIIISAIEHYSILECVRDLENNGDINVSYVSPNIYGNILAADVEKEIRQNTCLISIMFANNEIPAFNNIKEIGEIAHKNNIPMHSDCVQLFGKYKIDVRKNNIDAISASAHKFYGPKGIGILVLNNDLIDGYNLRAEINGSQQNGLRGGTENVAGIMSMIAALRFAFVNRKEKNSKLLKLRNYCLEKLQKIFLFNEYSNYLFENEEKEKSPLEIISLGPPAKETGYILPNTLLLAVCKNKGKPFCNVDLKKYLDSKGIIVSIGSACLTKSDKASHVISAIGAPGVVKRGVIRISFSDDNTVQEVNHFVKCFEENIKKQCGDIEISRPDENAHEN